MKLLNNILNLIAPHDCVSCGQEGDLLCQRCSLEAFEPIPSRCYRCKKLTDDFAVCSDCRRASKLSNVWICTEYGGIAKKLIHVLKFQSARSAADVIARKMDDILPFLPQDTVVTFVPTATKRQRQRSFDQAKIIAEKLAILRGLECKRTLYRLTHTRQVGAPRDVRLKQLNNAFSAKAELNGQTTLMVDDIVTTGGTIEAAAAELKRAGAKRVYAVTFAQK